MIICAKKKKKNQKASKPGLMNQAIKFATKKYN